MGLCINMSSTVLYKPNTQENFLNTTDSDGSQCGKLWFAFIRTSADLQNVNPHNFMRDLLPLRLRVCLL